MKSIEYAVELELRSLRYHKIDFRQTYFIQIGGTVLSVFLDFMERGFFVINISFFVNDYPTYKTILNEIRFYKKEFENYFSSLWC